MNVTKNPTDAIICAKHHGLGDWRVEEVWYAENFDIPLFPKKREYYWNSADVLKRIQELKDAGFTDRFVPQRTFVLKQEPFFGMGFNGSFLLEKGTAIEVKSSFEQTSTPVPRWKGINVYDYDVAVLKRIRATYGQIIVMAVMSAALALGPIVLLCEILTKVIERQHSFWFVISIIVALIIFVVTLMGRWINYCGRVGEKLAGIENGGFFEK